jgi:hypothetical protein
MTGTNPWIERVKAADAEAEAMFLRIFDQKDQAAAKQQALALRAIAAELRAQRIARRPGAGQ